MKRLWLFLGLTFGCTWGLGALFALFPAKLVAVFGAPSGTNPLFLLAVWAPTYSAILVVALTQGRAGLRDLFSRLLRWRIGWRWYALATVGIAVLALGARYLSASMAGPPAPALLAIERWPAWIGAGLMAFATDPGPLCEELGWRGYLLPRLEQRWSGLVSALVVGGTWGVWHLPAFFIAGLPQHAFAILPFMVQIVSLSILATWVVNHARGSVIPAILLHWAANRFEGMDPATAPVTALVIASAALLVVLSSGASLGAARLPAPPP